MRWVGLGGGWVLVVCISFRRITGRIRLTMNDLSFHFISFESLSLSLSLFIFLYLGINTLHRLVYDSLLISFSAGEKLINWTDRATLKHVQQSLWCLATENTDIVDWSDQWSLWMMMMANRIVGDLTAHWMTRFRFRFNRIRGHRPIATLFLSVLRFYNELSPLLIRVYY